MSALVNDDVFVGVEIELERSDRMSLTSSLDKYWRIEGDGSLRLNGAELVFREPLKGKDVVNALVRSEAVTRKCLFSDRCGVHVHIDAQTMGKAVFYEFVHLYVLFEPLLLGFCGASRENNNFCVPLYSNKEVLRYLSRLESKTQVGSWFAGNDFRYSALNFASLNNHGSLEFRAMRGTSDTDVLVPWINMLLSILNYASGLPDLLRMVEESSADVGNMILTTVFGDDLGELLYQTNKKDFHEKLLAGARGLQYVLRHRAGSALTTKLLSSGKAVKKSVAEEGGRDGARARPRIHGLNAVEFVANDLNEW